MFTLNNPEPKDFELVHAWAVQCSRICATLEVCPSTGTPHIQGAFTFSAGNLTLPVLKKLHDRAHWELSTNEECAHVYSLKHDSTVIVNKNETRPGARTDILAAYEAAERGDGFGTYLRANKPNLQTLRIFQLAAPVIGPDRSRGPIEFIWRWGAPGSGKSSWVAEKFPTAYRKGGIKWWDGYDGHETVWIDEVRKEYATAREWLELTDEYPLPLMEVKGGFVKVRFTRLIVTSQYHPQVLWEQIASNEDSTQLLRRITKCVKVIRSENAPAVRMMREVVEIDGVETDDVSMLRRNVTEVDLGNTAQVDRPDTDMGTGHIESYFHFGHK